MKRTLLFISIFLFATFEKSLNLPLRIVVVGILVVDIVDTVVVVVVVVAAFRILLKKGRLSSSFSAKLK